MRVRSTLVLPGDPAYPSSLAVLVQEPRDPRAGEQEARAPPPLYVRGELPSAPGVTIVGTRRPSDEAARFTRALARDLAAHGFCIWSGGAVGVDAAAHEGALDAGAPTVVVMGGGLDRAYPPEHKDLFARVLAQGGALVARVPDHVAPMPHGFHQRNQILAAASIATVVVQAGYKSGARSTTAAARKLGRPLFAVPHAPWDERGQGCALELVLGARPLTCAADLLAVLREDPSGAPLLPPLLPPPARRAPRRKATTRGKTHAENEENGGGAQLGLPRADEPTRERARLTHGARARACEVEATSDGGVRGEEINAAAGLSSARSVGEPSDHRPEELSRLPGRLQGGLQVLWQVLNHVPLHIDELCEASRVPFRDVVELLLTLTLQAVVVEGPAGYYRRVSRSDSRSVSQVSQVTQSTPGDTPPSTALRAPASTSRERNKGSNGQDTRDRGVAGQGEDD
jgi:DNA processing protein